MTIKLNKDHGNAVTLGATTEYPDAQIHRSFEVIYRQHFDWLLARLRYRFGDQAEDLVQEAYLRLAVAKTEVRHPRALLMTVARNLARNQVRGAGRAERALSDAGRPPATGEADQAEAVLLKQIILGLPEPLRSVFLMSRCEGLSTAQIAERLGIAPKTVEWRLTKALAHCAAQLRR